MYVFLMEKGEMHKLPKEYATATVNEIRNYLVKSADIPLERQILLASGGLNLDPSDRLDHGEGENETNPIFVFTKTNTNEVQYQGPQKLIFSDRGFMQKVERLLLQQNWTLQTLDELITDGKVLDRLSDQLMQNIEKLSNQQRLMLQGWQVAAAHLAEVRAEAVKELQLASAELQKVESNVISWESCLNDYEKIKSTLMSIPVLPQIAKHIDPEMPSENVDLFELLCRQRQMDLTEGPKCRMGSGLRQSLGGSLAGGLSSIGRSSLPSPAGKMRPASTVVTTVVADQQYSVTLRKNKILRRRTTSLRENLEETASSTTGASNIIVGSPDFVENGNSFRLSQHIEESASGSTQNISSSPLANEGFVSRQIRLSDKIDAARHSIEYLRSGLGRLEKTASILILNESRTCQFNVGELDPESGSCAAQMEESKGSEMTHFRLLIAQLDKKLNNVQSNMDASTTNMDESMSTSTVATDKTLSESTLMDESRSSGSALPKSVLMDESEYEAQHKQSASFLERSSWLGDNQSPFEFGPLSEQKDSYKFSQHLNFLKRIISDADQCRKLVQNRLSSILNIRSRANLRFGQLEQNNVCNLGSELFKAFQKLISCFDTIMERKISLSHFLHFRQSELQSIQSDINTFDKNIQLCIRQCREIAITCRFLSHMKSAPEVYIRALVEIVRRRQYESEWHSWHSIFLEDGNAVRAEEKSARERFKNINHPLIKSIFGSINDAKLCRFYGTSSSSSKSSKRVSSTTAAAVIKSPEPKLTFVRGMDSTRFSLRKTQLNPPTTTSMVRFEPTEEERSAPITSPLKKNISMITCNSVPDLVSFSQRTSLLLGKQGPTESTLDSAHRRGSLISSGLSPMMESSDAQDADKSVKVEDFKSLSPSKPISKLEAQLNECFTLKDLPNISREDVQQLCYKLPDNLREMLFSCDTEESTTCYDEDQGVFDSESVMESNIPVVPKIVPSMKGALLGLSPKSLEIFGRYRGLLQARLPSESSLYSQLAGSYSLNQADSPVVKKIDVGCQMTFGFDPLSTEIPQDDVPGTPATIISPELSCFKSVSDIMVQVWVDLKHVDTQTEENACEIFCSAYPNLDKDDDEEDEDVSSDGYFVPAIDPELAVEAAEVPTASNAASTNMITSFLPAQEEKTPSLIESGTNPRAQALLGVYQKLLKSFESGEGPSSSLVQEAINQLLEEKPVEKHDISNQSDVLTLCSQHTSMTQSFNDASISEAGVQVDLQQQSSLILPLPKKFFYEFVTRNFQRGDYVAFTPVMSKQAGSKALLMTASQKPDTKDSTFAVSMGESVMQIGSCSAEQQQEPQIVARSSDIKFAPLPAKGVLKELWRMVSSDGHVYFLNEEDNPAFEELAAKRVEKGFSRRVRVQSDQEEDSGMVPHSQRKHQIVIAQFMAKEFCETRRQDNRYNLPVDFKFFRVRAVPMSELARQQ